jgi:hypothetical protein
MRLDATGLAVAAGNAATQALNIYRAGTNQVVMAAGNSNTGLNGTYFGIDGTGNGLINTTGAFANVFSTNNAERMRITSGGSVGIGTTTIGSTLQVNGNAAIGYSASTAAPTNGLSISGNTTIGTTTAAGKFTIDPDDNQVGLAITGTSLTSANAQSLIDLAQTWNTTGNPTAIKLNITNTASGVGADLMELQLGGVSQFTVDKSGNTTMTGSIKTGAPTTGTSSAWKLGSIVSSSVAFDATRYLEVEVGGTFYRIGLVTAAEPEPMSSPDGYVPNYGPIRIVDSSEKVNNLEKEIAELRETIKLLKSKIK